MTTAANFAIDSDINDFDDFIQKLKGPKRSELVVDPEPVNRVVEASLEKSEQKSVSPDTANEQTLPEAGEGPYAIGGDEIFIKTVSHVSFHQKIRRAFVTHGPFRYDGLRRDISIEQDGDILQIFIDVSMSRNAKDKAASIWKAILKRIVDADWSVDIHDITYSEDERKVFILFASEKLAKKHPSRTKLPGWCRRRPDQL